MSLEGENASAEAEDAARERELAAARRRHFWFLAVSIAVAMAVLYLTRSVLMPFVLALVIAYVLTPGVRWFEARRVPPGIAIIVVYLVVFGSLGLFVRLTAPRVGHELANLRRELPALSVAVRDRWVPYVQGRLRAVGLGAAPAPDAEAMPGADAPSDEGEIEEGKVGLVARPRPDGTFVLEFEGPVAVKPSKGGGYTVGPPDEMPKAFDLDKIVADLAGKTVAYAQTNALEIVKFGRDVISGISRFFLIFGITLMLAAYMILTRDKIGAFLSSLVRPADRPSWRVFMARVDRGLSGVVRGQLIICVVNGLLSAVGFALVDLKYWPVLALVATVLSLIPIFGAIISSIPAVALGLTQSVGTAAFVLAWIVGIHQLEANFLNPKIMGDQAKIHPVMVIFSLLVGEHFFGVLGALLAVPVMSIAQSAFLHVRSALQQRDPEMAHELTPSTTELP